MKGIIMIFGIAILFVLAQASAHAGEFEEAKAIIDANTGCSALTEAQLEMIGDYYMEQMHPGEAHELMHKMMGGEDSETTKSMHTQMAKSIYCGETTGMMSMMSENGMMSLMGSGMMGMMGSSGTQSLMGSGMMGSSGMMNYGAAGYFGIPLYIWSFLYLLLVIGAVILIFVLIAKFSLDLKKQKKKK